MNALPLLLADFEVVKSMSNRFHGKQAHLHSSDLLMGLGLLVAVVIVACVLKRLTRKNGDRARYHNPRALFRELCQAHGIDRAGRSLLEQIAASEDVPPTRLFLEPELWQAAKLGADFASDQADCQVLCELLFARPDEPATQAPDPAEPQAVETATALVEPASQ